jgi:hypothetical protein
MLSAYHQGVVESSQVCCGEEFEYGWLQGLGRIVCASQVDRRGPNMRLTAVIEGRRGRSYTRLESS